MTPSHRTEEAGDPAMQVFDSDEAMAEFYAEQEAAFRATLRAHGFDDDDDDDTDDGAVAKGAVAKGDLTPVASEAYGLETRYDAGASRVGVVPEVPGPRGTSGGVYVGRPLENVAQWQAWAAAHGIRLAPKPHVTLVHSATPVEQSVLRDNMGTWRHTVGPSQFTHIGPLGDKGAIVLFLRCEELAQRNAALSAAGATSSYGGTYTPHVTITYEGEGVDWRRVPLPDFALVFGAERSGPLDGDVFAKMDGTPRDAATALVVKALSLRATLESRTPHIIAALREGMGEGQVRKAAEQRLVMGWASVVSDASGRVLRDRQGDVMKLSSVAKAARQYMQGARTGGVVHMKMPDGKGGTQPVRVGQVVEGLIVTPVVKTLLGLPKETPHGWAITMHVVSDAAWGAVKDKTFRAFSIGGAGERRDVTLPRAMVVE